MMTEEQLTRLAQEQAVIVFRERQDDAGMIDSLMRAFLRGYHASHHINVQGSGYGSYEPSRN
jgi:hypothetical protein